MHVEQWIVVVSILGGVVFGLAAALLPQGRLRLAVPAVVLFVIAGYEIRMDRWEHTVAAPIRLDMVPEIALTILCFTFGIWQILSSRKKKVL
jgi:hypothetical protein